MPKGKVVNEGTEADALNDAVDLDPSGHTMLVHIGLIKLRTLRLLDMIRKQGIQSVSVHRAPHLLCCRAL
jgi:hypothetical protein